MTQLDSDAGRILARIAHASPTKACRLCRKATWATLQAAAYTCADFLRRAASGPQDALAMLKTNTYFNNAAKRLRNLATLGAITKLQ